MPIWNSLWLPNANSPLMEQMLFFHDHTSSILSMIITLVFYMLLSALINNLSNKTLLEGQELETIWTSLPALLLIFIAFPSLHILYSMEESPSPSITLKVIGHQWYWSYQYSNLKNFNMDTFMDTNNPKFHFLDINQRVMIPYLTPTRLLVTSLDVIHSWTIPTLGIKTDATPGRLNQLITMPLRPGLFFGQCSEICGTHHSFMPIILQVSPLKPFLAWLNLQ